MNIVEKIQQFSKCVEIAHHIPGRIRVRLLLDELPELDPATETLVSRVREYKDALESIPGVRSLRVNVLARSCTIEYDRQTIPFEAWEDFLAGASSEAADVLGRIIHQKYAEVACA